MSERPGVISRGSMRRAAPLGVPALAEIVF